MKPNHRGPEGLKVVVDRAGDLAVGRVEVAMGQAVAHPGDVAPGVTRLGVEELWRDGLDRLSDLDEADADSIEDQAI